jgi:plastocyanin
MSYSFFRNTHQPFRPSVKPVLALCASFMVPMGFASAAPPSGVEITKFAFAPRELTIAPGTTIVWTNRDETPHTVAANDKSFASKGLDTDDKYEHTFSSEGNFTYYCTLHPMMTGIVHVRKQ